MRTKFPSSDRSAFIPSIFPLWCVPLPKAGTCLSLLESCPWISLFLDEHRSTVTGNVCSPPASTFSIKYWEKWWARNSRYLLDNSDLWFSSRVLQWDWAKTSLCETQLESAPLNFLPFLVPLSYFPTVFFCKLLSHNSLSRACLKETQPMTVALEDSMQPLL